MKRVFLKSIWYFFRGVLESVFEVFVSCCVSESSCCEKMAFSGLEIAVNRRKLMKYLLVGKASDKLGKSADLFLSVGKSTCMM